VTGEAAAVFHVYDRQRLDAVPRRYTVESGKTLDDTWPADADGGYDLWVMGPNGFLRHVTGTVPSADIQVEGRAGKGVAVRFVNDSADPVTFVMRANAYRNVVRREVRVPAGEERTRRWSLSRKHRWYDFTVTSSAVRGFSRRFAGRAENGRKSISDP